MTINTSKVVDEFSEVPMFEVSLTKNFSVPYKKGDTFAAAASILHSILDKSPVEKMVVLYMDHDANIVGAETVAIGETISVSTSFQNLLRGAILAGVPDIIVGHNHVTGPVYPSDPDLAMTGMSLSLASLTGIRLYDHIIVGPQGESYSILDHTEELIPRMKIIQLRQLISKMVSTHKMATPLF